jgi:thioredoxin 1
MNQSNKKNQNAKYFSWRKILISGILLVAVFVLIYGKNSKESVILDSGANEITLNDQNFEKVVLQSDKLVMVDFWATWCGPCRMLAPTIAKISKDYEGKIIVGKLDVDQSTNIAGEYNISSIPTLIFFKNGKPVDMEMGVVPEEMIKQKIDLLLKN